MAAQNLFFPKCRPLQPAAMSAPAALGRGFHLSGGLRLYMHDCGNLGKQQPCRQGGRAQACRLVDASVEAAGSLLCKDLNGVVAVPQDNCHPEGSCPQSVSVVRGHTFKREPMQQLQ